MRTVWGRRAHYRVRKVASVSAGTASSTPSRDAIQATSHAIDPLMSMLLG